MKIDRSKIRKSHSQPAPECQQLIQRLTDAKDSDLVHILKSVDTWFYGKCDLGHWADVLDKFDDILASVAKQVNGSAWILTYDKLDILEGPEVATEKKELVNQVLRFTALLIEHAYSRPAYNSAEHLIALLGASDMEVVLSVLGLLYVFSKRCSFIPRLPADKRKPLQQRLLHIGENWGGKNGGFSLAECCKDKPLKEFPESAGDVHFEFYTQGGENQTEENVDQEKESQVCFINVEKLFQFSENPGEIMEQLMAYYKVPTDKQVGLFSRVRLARQFPCYQERLRCVQARLWAISVLVYSNVSQDIQKSLMYQGFEEEVVELLQLEDSKLLDIKTAGIRLLTSVIHLQFNPRLNTIVECAGMASYHGFLPTLMRNCIQTLIDPNKTSYPMSFSTALFSFVYHFACFEVGNEALVSSGLVESLLKVIEYAGDDEHLTFVTRSVRIMDWIGNTDTSGYQSGLTAVINRLEHEVKICMPHHGGILTPDLPQPTTDQDNTATMETNEASPPPQDPNNTVPMETEQAGPSGVELDANKMEVEEANMPHSNPTALQVTQHRCLPQRAALIKALLSFLKKAIPDPAFSETIRTIMEGSLPTSLKYIISNVEYYGPVLFLGAIDTVTVYVFHEPSLLSSLQDNGLTGVVMKSLVLKDIPAMREVLSSLPSVLSALCLNNRGLQAFMACQPFDKLFKVMLSPEYLPAMRRKKATEELGETASNLGIAMDELMRHQPTLKSDAMKAVVKLLEQVCELGQDPKCIGYKIADVTKDGDLQESPSQGNVPTLPSQASEEPMTDDEFDDDDRFSFTSASGSAKPSPEIENSKDKELTKGSEEKRDFVPLTDYILNVVKFVDAILSNNSTDDHCREFVRHKGLVPLLGILGLPNLPLDFPTSPSCQAVCSVSKSLLMLAHEPQVLKQGLVLLKESLDKLQSSIYNPSENTDLSICHEVVSASKPDKAMHSPQQTPLLHAVTAVHASITMFLYVCRSGQMDIRTMCINQWGSDLGQTLLNQLGELYMSLLWETTVLETVEKEEVDLMNENKESTEESSAGNIPDESNKEEGPSGKTSKIDNEQKSPLMPSQRRIVKQLLQVTSGISKSLSEFFSALLKLSVGTTQKQRRPPHSVSTPTIPSVSAKVVTSQLCKALKNALSCKGAAADKSSPGLRLHFYVNIINFASRLLFDDKKFPYHLMLQQFMMSGALNSLFEKFNWVLSQGGQIPLDIAADHLDIPDGTEEMIDAWLVFVEKLVNTKAILESPHSLPTSSTAEGFVPFKPIQFLIKAQKRAFTAVGHLWGHKPFKVHGSHIAETMLAILCHIVQGESVITEKQGAIKPTTGKVGAASGEATQATPSTVVSRRAVTPPPPEVNGQNVQQLIDMGFTRAQARHALMSTSGLEQATEYILNHPYPIPSDPPVEGNQPHEFGLDYDMSEEDQMMRAIALSLGQDVSPMAVDQPAAASSSSLTKKTLPLETTCEDETQLSKHLLDSLTFNIFPGCRQLLEELPDTVYKACKLLAAIAKRNGSEWRDKVLAEVMDQVGKDAVTVTKNCNPDNNKDKYVEEFVPQMCTMPEAARLSSLLHLSCLMFEEMKVSCAVLLDQYGIVNSLMDLLDLCQASLFQLGRTVSEPTTPKWLCPLLLLLDLYEKTALSSERKKSHDKCTTRTWRWFDDRSGRWYAYSATNNEAIDAAYRSGETRTRFMAGRRPYNVNFSTMLQINEDTDSRRPIMLGSTYESSSIVGNRPGQPAEGPSTGGDTLQRLKLLGKAEKKTTEEKQGSLKESGKEIVDERVVQRLNETQKTAIIRCCAVLISIPVNNNALHAALRLCLRITQEHEYAVQFVNQGGHKAIISLTQKSSFPGFTSITTLLLHHVLEDLPNLQNTIEKVIRSVAVNGVSNSATGVSFNSVGAKEINYVLRLLGPAASRNPELFKEAVLKMIRYAITPQLRRVLVEGADVYLPSNHPQLVKVSPAIKPQKPPQLCESVREVVCDLLNALCAPSDAAYRAGGRMGSICVRRSDSQMLGEFGRALGQIGDMIDRFSTNNREQSLSPGHPSYGRQITSEDTVVDSEEAAIDSQPDTQEPTTPQTEKPREKAKDVSKEKESKESKEKEAATKPLLTKSAILRILAELVKTYGGVALLITEYTYSPPQMPGGKQYEGPVLAYIFDHLLISSQTNTSNDSPAFARLLLAVIATCTQAPEAQQILVTELKASLERALALPESPGKHHRLQALFGLIQTMIDSGSRLPQQALVQPPNNTMKLLTKRGLITDLAKVTHSLDLGSPYLVTTLNSLLKPLEKLSSIVNQPAGGPSATQNKATTQSTGVGTSDGASFQQEGPTSVATEENQGTTSISVEPQSQGDQVQTQDADVQATPDLSEPEDTQTSGGELDGEESVAAWDLGVSGHAVVPISGAEEAFVSEDIQDIVDQLLDREPERHDSQDPEMNVVSEEIVTQHMLDDSDVFVIDGNDDEDEDEEDDVDDDDSGSSSTDEQSDGQHGDSDAEGSMVITFEATNDRPEESNERNQLNVQQDDVDDEERVIVTGPDNSDENVIVMGEVDDGDEDIEDEEEDDDCEDDDDEGSDMEEEHHDMMEDDSFAVYEDDDMFLHIRDVQDEDSDAGVVLGLTGQRHRGLPIRHHNAGTDVFHITTGGHETRFLVGDDGQMRAIADEDGLFVDGYNESTSSIPSALSRWSEESQILDPESVHYCVSALKPEIFPVFEKRLSEDVDKEKVEEAKKKKETEAKAAAKKKDDDEAKKKAESEAATSATANQQTSEDMQVDQSSAPRSAPVATDDSSTSLLVSMSMDHGSDGESAVQTSTPRDPKPTVASATNNTNQPAGTEGASSASLDSQGSSLVPPVSASSSVSVDGQSEGVAGEAGASSSVGSPMTLGSETSVASDSGVQGQASEVDVAQDATDDNEEATDRLAPQPGASTSCENTNLTIDGVSIPDGVDPSFLEALPESLRREVLSEQLGLRPAPTSQQSASGEPSTTSVSPEFLAALPPDVQEEVLQQQRLEQERRRTATATPDQPVDPGAFLRNLPPSLRQTVLADIDDSLLNVLPAEMATEAQSLRRDREVRQQRLMQERFALGVGDTASAISALLRHSGLSRRTVGGGGLNFPRYFSANSRGFSNTAPRANHKYAGRQLLDHDALACLVVLLFIDEPRLNMGRLQKVFRNLCYHEETRRWLINTLIAVLRRTSGRNEDDSCPFPNANPSTQGEATPSTMVTSHDPSRDPSRDSCASASNIGEYLLVKGEQSLDSRKSKQPSWLRIALDSALGSRTNVFRIRRQGKLGLENSSHISIHQYASPFICRHVLDALLFLAKTFSSSFMPGTSKAVASCKITDSIETEDTTEKITEETTTTTTGDSDFWDILLKLDAMGLGSKGKYAASSSVTQSTSSKKEDEFSEAPIGQLLTLVAHPVVGKNVQLTDKLLRLLSVVSASLPDLPATNKKTAKSNLGEGVTSALDEATENQSGQNLVVPLPQVVTPEAVRAVSLVLEHNEEHGTSATNLSIPISETESIASSLVVERSSEPGGEHPESIDSGSSDEVAPNLGQTEPMVVEVNIPHETNREIIDRPSSLLSTNVSLFPNPDLPLGAKPESEQTIVLESHLRLAVNVLTSGACSEEGLEDATNLLLQISRLNLKTRDAILRLLLDGARKIGEVLRACIATLFIEIVEHNKKSIQKAEPDKYAVKGKKASNVVLPEPPRRQQRTTRALFGLQEPITTAAATGRRQTGPKPVVYELHLPSMPLLTCKKSSQALLLKVLKVILQLREAAKKSGKTQGTRDSRRGQRRANDVLVSHRLIESSRGLGAVVAALEAEAEAIFEVFSSLQGQRREDRDAEREVQRSQSGQPGSSTSEGAAATEGPASEVQGASATSEAAQPAEPEPILPLLSEQLALDDLWDTLGECLTELAKTTDNHAVLVLQPAVEAFFLVHGSEKTVPHTPPSTGLDVSQRLSVTSTDMLPPSASGPLSPGPLSPSRQQSVSSVTSDLPSDTQKFLKFAETHRTVLNQILRQSNVHLSDGPFAVLVDHTRVLDFDVKRRFFRQELEQADEGIRRDDLQVHLRRDQIFENSYRELHRRSPEEWKSRFYIVFEGEEGQDAGGLLREWYLIMSREMFNPNYALFTTSPGDRVTYQPNPTSHCNSNHLSYFKFVGRVVAKAIYDNKLLECFFTRSFYKHILGKPVHFTDLESFDYSFYQGLQFLLEHDIQEIGMDLTFSTDVQEFGLSEIRDLIPNGRNIPVTEDNKRQYVKLVCQMKMTGAIRKQIDSFLEGFYEVIPKRLISIFDEQELELLISGLPNIDLDDLKANTEYHKYNENSLQTQWFWRALRSFDQADRAKFLQFVTGTSKVPLQGFAALEGMNGFQKFQIHRDDRNTDRLPSAHTCFNQLDLPAYETYDKLRTMLKKACDECPEGFGLA